MSEPDYRKLWEEEKAMNAKQAAEQAAKIKKLEQKVEQAAENAKQAAEQAAKIKKLEQKVEHADRRLLTVTRYIDVKAAQAWLQLLIGAACSIVGFACVLYLDIGAIDHPASEPHYSLIVLVPSLALFFGTVSMYGRDVLRRLIVDALLSARASCIDCCCAPFARHLLRGHADPCAACRCTWWRLFVCECCLHCHHCGIHITPPSPPSPYNRYTSHRPCIILILLHIATYLTSIASVTIAYLHQPWNPSPAAIYTAFALAALLVFTFLYALYIYRRDPTMVTSPFVSCIQYPSIDEQQQAVGSNDPSRECRDS